VKPPTTIPADYASSLPLHPRASSNEIYLKDNAFYDGTLTGLGDISQFFKIKLASAPKY